jgi:cysteine-rich secretory family protein/carboxypeptidase family protein
LIHSRKTSSVPSFRVEKLELRRLLTATGVEPTAAEQYMLELVNRARANPAAEASADGIDLNEGLAPGTISPDPKQPLAFNPLLISAARSHSNWMIQNDTFAHDEGSVDPGGQMSAAGYPFVGNWTWGQNIAFRGQTVVSPNVPQTVAQEENDLFIDAGIAGRGHRTNLMNDSFKEIGVGVGTGDYQGYNAVMTTQDFAAESGDSFLTGVAYRDSDGNKFYSVGEGLGSITITATRASDNAVFSTTTWSAGGYTLTLAPGTYSVTATGAGLGTVTTGNVTISDRNVQLDFTPAGGSSPTITPPTVTKGIVTGLVFRDNNANATRDPREPALGGWRVYADLNNDGFYEKGEPFTLTNGRGVYKLALAPGDYTLRVVQKKGFQPTSNPDGQPVTISQATTLTASPFSEQKIPVVKVLKTRTLLDI